MWKEILCMNKERIFSRQREVSGRELEKSEQDCIVSGRQGLHSVRKDFIVSKRLHSVTTRGCIVPQEKTLGIHSFQGNKTNNEEKGRKLRSG